MAEVWMAQGKSKNIHAFYVNTVFNIEVPVESRIRFRLTIAAFDLGLSEKQIPATTEPSFNTQDAIYLLKECKIHCMFL